jgi:excisionase family DNA binding protein
MIPKTLTVREAAEKTGFSSRKVYTLVRRGDWQVVREQGKTSTLHILEASIEAWFDRQQQRTPFVSHLDPDRELGGESRFA